MLSDKEIIDNFGVEKIITKYPPSGQKNVVLVQHKVFGTVILKIVEGQSERVKREIEIVTKNNFDNVPKVLEVNSYNIGNQNGIYLFEEYIDGENLREILDTNSLYLQEAMDLTEQLLRICVQMENKEVVHRDIKPDNIIRDKNGSWYLIDFGIARALSLHSLTMTEVQMGPHTPGYGAPELFQYNKRDIDSRSDIFSIGVVVFEAVTGKHPFVRGDELNINEIWYNTVTIMPQSIIIEGDKDMQFMALVQTFMQKHVTRRPATAKKAMEWFLSIKKDIVG